VQVAVNGAEDVQIAWRGWINGKSKENEAAWRVGATEREDGSRSSIDDRRL